MHQKVTGIFIIPVILFFLGCNQQNSQVEKAESWTVKAKFFYKHRHLESGKSQYEVSRIIYENGKAMPEERYEKAYKELNDYGAILNEKLYRLVGEDSSKISEFVENSYDADNNLVEEKLSRQGIMVMKTLHYYKKGTSLIEKQVLIYSSADTLMNEAASFASPLKSELPVYDTSIILYKYHRSGHLRAELTTNAAGKILNVVVYPGGGDIKSYSIDAMAKDTVSYMKQTQLGTTIIETTYYYEDTSITWKKNGNIIKQEVRSPGSRLKIEYRYNDIGELVEETHYE